MKRKKNSKKHLIYNEKDYIFEYNYKCINYWFTKFYSAMSSLERNAIYQLISSRPYSRITFIEDHYKTMWVDFGDKEKLRIDFEKLFNDYGKMHL